MTATEPTSTTLGHRNRVASVLVHLLMVVLAIAFLIPMIWMLSASLKPEAEVMQIPPTLLPSTPQWHNYSDVARVIPRYFINSVFLAVVNVVGQATVAALAGYGFARIAFRGRNVVFGFVLATAIVPSIVYLLPQYILFDRIGWIDTFYPLWVPAVLTPIFGTFLMRQAFMPLPQDLVDAGRLDGASTFRIFAQVMLPQVKPSLATVGTFAFLGSWNDLFGPLIFINSPERQTLPVALALFRGEFFTQVSLLMAAAAITVLPVLLVFMFAQRYFVQGITTSGLRG